MTSTEDRVRAAMDAITSQVDTASPPPLRLPPPRAARRRGRPSPRRHWRPWLAPAAAAIAVIAVAATLVAVRNTPAGRPAPAASASVAPEYYVALSPIPQLGLFSAAGEAAVGDTFTGQRIATVHAPRGWGFSSVSAADDDRTFVLAVQRLETGPLVTTRWDVLRLTPGAAQPATLSQLPIAAQSLLQSEFSAALSPDGTMLAVVTPTDTSYTGGAGSPELRVYSTATGALLHTWSGGLRGIQTLSLVSWTSDDRRLIFQTAASNNGPVVVRTLPVNDQGNVLLADSKPVVSFTTSVSAARNCVDGFLATGNGQTVVCGSAVQVPASEAGGTTCAPYGNPFDTAILRFSTVTGQLAAPLYQVSDICQRPGDLALYWVNEAGTAVLGYLAHQQGIDTTGQFGLFTKGTFTPLPTPLENDEGQPSITAW